MAVDIWKFSHPKETTFVLIVVFSCSLFHFMTANPLELMPALALKSNVQAVVTSSTLTDQTKHASKLSPKITEEMIADEDEDSIFETIEEDSGRIEDKEETYDFAEDDKRDEESLRRKGYRIFSSN